MPIKNWSTTAASNNSAAPNGFPENMAPSGVNDAARQVMADVRAQCEDAEWFNWGDTPSRASATTFKIGADVTTRYLVNRAIKCYDGSTLYGIVTASSYSAPDTTVTVNLDSGSLTTSLSSVALAILSPTNRAIPTALGRKGADVASASTINLSTAAGDFVDVTGTTTITAITSEAAGIRRKVRFTGALTLTHDGTALILPSAANITTATNDRAEFISLGSGNWLCFSYTRANGTALAGSISAAAQADQETGSSTTTYVSPGRQQYHPSAAKAWVLFNSKTSTTVTSSYNVSSLTDNGVGDTTINFTTPFSGASAYGGVGISGLDTSAGTETQTDTMIKDTAAAPTASAFRVQTSNSTGTAEDMARTFFVFFGDQ